MLCICAQKVLELALQPASIHRPGVSRGTGGGQAAGSGLCP